MGVSAEEGVQTLAAHVYMSIVYGYVYVVNVCTTAHICVEAQVVRESCTI